MNRGNLVVLGIVLLALFLAGFAVWWNVESGRRTLEFWGRDAGERIIAPQARVELLWLQPLEGDSAPQPLDVRGRRYSIVATADVTAAPGLVHARHALLDDPSFEWQAPTVPAAQYTLAVRFRDGAGTTTVAFDFRHRQLAHAESGRQQIGSAKIMQGWQKFARRHAPAAVANDP